MSEYQVGDKIVFAPHGAGTIVKTTYQDDEFGEYLSILINHSNMTLLVPSDTAEEKGVRAVIAPKRAQSLLRSLQEDGASLPENPQMRTREGLERTKSCDADEIAGVLRDYTELERGGKKLTAAEQRTLDKAKSLMAGELSLVEDIALSEALARIELALGNTMDDE